MRFIGRTQSQPNSPIGALAHLLERVPASKPLLDLSQGAPGFPPAPAVVARIAEVSAEPDGARYTPLFGLPDLRDAMAADLGSMYGGDIAASEVCITAGCNQAYCVVVSALAEHGDDVILTVPYYFNHDMWLGLDGIEARYLEASHGIMPSVDEAAKLIGARTRALVLVSPGNPTGLILPPSLLSEFADLAAERNIVLIIDETYRSFVPGGRPPHELFARSDWRDHIVSLHSFSKDLAIPGHRVGAIVASPALLNEAAKLLDCVSICAPRIGQEAALAGLRDATDWRQEKIDEIGARRERFEQVMSARPGGFELISAGAYYGWVRHPFDDSSEEVATRLLLEQGVLVLPGSAFAPTDPKCVRFSFANADIDRLDELNERLDF